MHDRWHPQDEATLVMVFADHSVDRLAVIFDRSEEAIRQKARELGLSRRCAWEEYEDEIIRDMWRKHTGREIAEVLTRSPASVSRRAKKIGLKRLTRPWTTKEDQYLLMMAGEQSAAEMGKKLRRTKQAVTHRLSVRGIKTNQGKRTLSEAAEILGTSTSTLLRRIRKIKIKHMVVSSCGDVTDAMLVKIAKSFLAKPSSRGPCNLSARRLREVIVEHGGDVKKKKAKRSSKGDDDKGVKS